MEISSPTNKDIPLFVGGKLRCPHDKHLHDLLSYKRFDLIPEFEHKLNVVLRCMFCGHMFSPVMNDQEMKMVEEAFDVN
jgi:hypothetical protein